MSQETMKSVEVGSSSPWGQIQHMNVLADGIYAVSSAGHGGIKLSKEMNAKVPKAARKAGGWYEEDCEWSIVALVFPSAFKPEVAKAAKETAKWWETEAYEAITGEVVPVEASHSKSRAAFAESVKDKWVCYSASGSWHSQCPKGMVLCHCCIGIRGNVLPEVTKVFLVPEEEYQTRGVFGFVIDPEKHKEFVGELSHF